MSDAPIHVTIVIPVYNEEGILRGSVLERVLDGQIVVRRDLAESEFPEVVGRISFFMPRAYASGSRHALHRWR